MLHDTELLQVLLISVFIFFARICDVSIGTLRIIFISKGYKKIAPLIGFVEVLIWITAVSRIMQHLDNWVYYFVYAAGFAAGNYVGMTIEEKLAMGYEMIRIITKNEATKLFEILKLKGYNITSVKALGNEGEVAVLFVVIRRNMVKDTISLITQHHPEAFYTIEDIRLVNIEK